MNDRKVVPIEDAIAAAEKELDDALWEGSDARSIKVRLRSLKLAQKVGEEWETSW